MSDTTEERSLSLLEHANPDAGAGLTPVVKALFIGEADGAQSNALAEKDRVSSILVGKGVLEPSYPPIMLGLIYENSSALRQNVDAYVTNIDSFGHTLVPVIDLEQDEADDKIRDAIRAERTLAKRFGKLAKDPDALAKANEEPSPADVKARKKTLAIEIQAEKEMLDSFFENCTPTMPFSGPEGLRGLTRQDIEVFGYGYWEVLRNGLKAVSQFNRLPARSIRLLPEDATPTQASMWRRVSALSMKKVPVMKRFRRFLQVYEAGGQVVYFKEFGDPRIVSAKTGEAFADLKALKAAFAERNEDLKDFVPATEIISFKISSVRGEYGAPRWIGTLVDVLGSRQASEVNFLYFENRSVPPLAILVSGGKLNDNTVKRLEDHIVNEVRGKRNFHKIMILEAEGQDTAVGPNTGRMKIEIHPLTDSQQKDGLFQAYDERNADKVGQAFRLPRLLRGDVRDFNRSCYSADTETLTETGWKLYHEIGPTEKIAAFDPNTGEMAFVVPAQKLVYAVKDEPMFRYHNQQTDFNVTGDHTVLVRSIGANEWEIETAESVTQRRRFEVPTMVQERSLAGTTDSNIEVTEIDTEHDLERSTYSGDVYCFSVPGYGFFVTRRKGKVAIQGNTAEASIDFAEIQVFGPIRQQFDWMVNKLILPELGVKYHQFRSNAPTIRDPEALAEMVAKLSTAGVLTPEECREIVELVFNRQFRKIDEDWAKMPIGLSLAGHQDGGGSGDFMGDGTKPKPNPKARDAMSAPGAAGNQAAVGVDQSKRERVASALQKIHKYMLLGEREAYADLKREHIKISAEDMAELVTPDPPIPDPKV